MKEYSFCEYYTRLFKLDFFNMEFDDIKNDLLLFVAIYNSGGSLNSFRSGENEQRRMIKWNLWGLLNKLSKSKTQNTIDLFEVFDLCNDLSFNHHIDSFVCMIKSDKELSALYFVVRG